MNQKPPAGHLLGGAMAAAVLALTCGLASAEDIASVPREETLVLTPWGDQPAQFANLENWNPYLLPSVSHQRDVMEFTINEMLFYTNLNTGELIPWQGESFSYADDFLTATIKLRDGVKWSDGTPFTADDVKFTLEALRDAPAQVNGSASFNEWVDSVDAIDPLTATIHFKKPAPRFVRDFLALGHENHYPILPKHVWEGEDIGTFTNYDPAADLPMGTGPYKLVSNTAQQEVFDRRDDWWGVATGFQDAPAPRRIILVPVSSDEAMGQLHIANQVDGGRQLQIGTFEAARFQNPNLRSWNDEGPGWGAPDGCDYTMVFNNLLEPWNSRDLHYAVNYALDRSKLSEIAYEGAMPPVTFAFSGYMSSAWVKEGDPLYDVLQKVQPRQSLAGRGRQPHAGGRLRAQRRQSLGQGRQGSGFRRPDAGLHPAHPGADHPAASQCGLRRAAGRGRRHLAARPQERQFRDDDLRALRLALGAARHAQGLPLAIQPPHRHADPLRARRDALRQSRARQAH